MTIDGNIHSRVAGIAYVALIAWWAIATAMRFGVVFKSEHLRDPGQSLPMSPWTILDAHTRNAEGLEFQRAYRRYSIRWLLVMIAIFLLLDAIF